jgi:hypothetical protein
MSDLPTNQRDLPRAGERYKTMPTKYCQLCTDEAPCGKDHVYVIELDAQVTNARVFQAQNPDLPQDALCFYVGSSRHTPQCRLRQHQLWSSEASTFPCTCFGEETVRAFSGSGGKTRGARKAIVKHSKNLRSRMFRRYNPIDPDAEATEREAWLAEQLRSMGYGAYQK